MTNNIKNFIKIKNNKFTLDIEPSNILVRKKLIYSYYKKLIQDEMEKKIKIFFNKLSIQYEFDLDIFSLRHIYILKEIYDNPLYNKELHSFQEELLFLKKEKFLNYNKEKEIYRITKKTKLFMFEFNANFWLYKYENIIFKYEKTLYTNFEFTWNKIKNDINKEFNKENDYING